MPRSRLYSPTCITSRTRSCSSLRICWSTASIPRRRSSRLGLVVTGGILHGISNGSSLHLSLAPGKDLDLENVSALELLARRATDGNMTILRPDPAVVGVVLHHLVVEVHVDEAGILRLVIEGQIAAD